MPQGGGSKMETSEKLRIAISQAIVILKMINEGGTKKEISETLDINEEIIDKIISNVNRLKAHGMSSEQAVAFLSTLIKR